MKFLLHPKAPLVVGTLLLIAAMGYLALRRSSPGDVSEAHFKVAGSSLVTDCNKCHVKGGRPTGCVNCHHEIADQLRLDRGFHAHLLRNKPQACTPCHIEHHGRALELAGPVAWQGLDRDNFKHPHVKYTLTGKHDTLKCEQCHGKAKPFSLKKFPKIKRKRTFLGLRQDCAACHKDPHANGAANACASCHDQKGWRPAPFFNHDKFYPLRNGHRGVDCKKCHEPPGPGVKPKPGKFFTKVKGKECLDCHKNPHRVDWGKNCQACHEADARPWSKAGPKVTAALHERTGFSLKKPHHQAKCGKCHGGRDYNEKYPRPGSPGYARSPKRCETCHKDPHGGQFTRKFPACVDCHNLTGFKPHHFTEKEHTQYPLTGGHAKKACEKCHFADKLKGWRRFSGTSRACGDCHRDIHRGQLAEKGKTRCEKCHGSFVSWRKTVFDHNTMSSYKLDQAHAKVKCEGCHPKVQAKDGQTLFLYKPLKKECKDCHAI